MIFRTAALLAALLTTCGIAAAQDANRLTIATEGAYPPFNSIAADGSIVAIAIRNHIATSAPACWPTLPSSGAG